jgi:putative DNA primase/helicase
MNKLSVLAGNPDNGKSLISLYMVAQITRGLPMYGDSRAIVPASGVLMMVAEDDLADTCIPRLQAAGADITKVKFLESIVLKEGKGKTEIEREAQLDTDIKAIESFLQQHPNIRMLVVDPVSSYMGRANMNREQEVRAVLTPLKKLAERRQIAVVTVMHLNKVGDQAAIHRIGGAVAFTGVARAVWLFMQDEEDRTKRLMLRVKNNIAKSTGGLVFNIQEKMMRTDDGEMTGQPVVSWIGETESSASDLILSSKQAGRPEKVSTAVEWLKQFLEEAGGSQLAVDVQSFGKSAKFPYRTLQRAKEELKIIPIQRDRKWYWQLPVAPVYGEPSVDNSVSFDKPIEPTE